MGTARYQNAGSGTSVLGLSIGGQAGSVVNATEEFTGDTGVETASTIDFD